MDRPKDIIDFIEEQAAANGNFSRVDEHYHRAFVSLTEEQIENLAIALMLDQQKVMRQLASKHTGLELLHRATETLGSMFSTIGMGVARLDAFGRLSFVARIGPESTAEMEGAVQDKLKRIEPVVANIVEFALPWVLARNVFHSQDPE